MANSQFIMPNVFLKISEEQILTWRKETYSNLHKKMTYSKKDMEELDNTPIMSMDQIKNSIKNRLIMYQSTGKLYNPDSVFVMIDSCILCKFPLPTIIAKFKKVYNMDNKNLILVVSQINLTENYYKLVHKHNYPMVDFKRLNYNLNFLEGKKEFKMKNIVILQTDIIFDNKVLIQEEVEFLHSHENWKPTDRNDINDNAQLQILIYLNKMFLKDCYLISRDRALLNKINIASYTNKSLYSYDFI